MAASHAAHSTSLSIAAASYSRSRRRRCGTSGSSDGSNGSLLRGCGAARTTPTAPWRKVTTEGGRRIVVSSATSPRIDDVDLLVGDMTVLWIFALFQKTSSVVLSETFPGWLAPVTVDPASFASFLGESAWLISTWGAVATVLGAYELEEDVLGKEEGEMREAVKGATITWAAWCLPAGGGVLWLSHIAGLRSSFPPGVTLGTALGVMIAWRAYAKVIGLLGWWRADREVKSPKEEDDWNFLYNSLAGSAAVATAAAALDFVMSSGRGGPLGAADGFSIIDM